MGGRPIFSSTTPTALPSSSRLLERRRKQAKFRDPQKTLYNFDFSFNQKMNRSLVFDLVLLGGVWIHLPPTSGTTL